MKHLTIVAMVLLFTACQHLNTDSPNTPENIPDSFKENAQIFTANIEADGKKNTVTLYFESEDRQGETVLVVKKEVDSLNPDAMSAGLYFTEGVVDSMTQQGEGKYKFNITPGKTWIIPFDETENLHLMLDDGLDNQTNEASEAPAVLARADAIEYLGQIYR